MKRKAQINHPVQYRLSGRGYTEIGEDSLNREERRRLARLKRIAINKKVNKIINQK